MSFTIESRSPEETAAVGGALATYLRAGDVLLLIGDLGAGKTALAKAIAAGLGVTETVTSPTFSVANRYLGRVAVAHLDGYRLEHPDDEEFGLALETIGEDAVAIVEWPDALAGALPAARLTVRLFHQGPKERLLAFEVPDATLSAEISRDLGNLGLRHVHPRPESGTDPSGVATA